jgi:hypothetical protein
MADNNRGWTGDSEGHRQAARESHKSKTNWWPLLFIPVAFGIGWWGGDKSNDQNQQSYQAQPGVGGGPEVSITPGANNGR